VKALVTGATGFLGGALARRLLADEHSVVGTGRDAIRGAALTADGVAFEPADLNDSKRLAALAEGCDAVFHCAALSSVWGDTSAFEQANVEGTRNVVRACQAGGVGRLVHVSTPSVYHSGEDRFDVSEDSPLPPPVNEYARTKLLAEEIVIEAHRAGLPSVIIRPRGLFGPGDTTVFPRVLRLLQAGRLKVIGDGSNVVDLTYVDNVVDALLDAATAPASAMGRIYNITNGEPVKLWELLAGLAERLDLPPPRGRVSLGGARAFATLLEWTWRLFPLRGEPPITRYSVELLALSMTLDLSAARSGIGYSPRVSINEGVDRFLDWWKTQESGQ